jgi:hypothetical protein
MPLFHCTDCHHEWEGTDEDYKCEWCGEPGRILEEKTPLEKMTEPETLRRLVDKVKKQSYLAKALRLIAQAIAVPETDIVTTPTDKILPRRELAPGTEVDYDALREEFMEWWTDLSVLVRKGKTLLNKIPTPSFLSDAGISPEDIDDIAELRTILHTYGLEPLEEIFQNLLRYFQTPQIK